ncbi:hypothetical protein GW17_00004786 [Ensete ventricosum]|nr:hypothetical protein GW17_00004786 [Ensete ventricosum]
MFLLPEKPARGEEISPQIINEKLVHRFLLPTIVEDSPRETGKTHTARYIPVRQLTEEEEEKKKKKKKKKKRRRSTSRRPSDDSARGSSASRCRSCCPSAVAARG